MQRLKITHIQLKTKEMLIPGALIMLFTHKIQSIVKSSFYSVNSEKFRPWSKYLMEELKTEPGLSLFQSCITFAQKETYANIIMKIYLCTIHTEALLLPGNMHSEMSVYL